MDNNERNKGEEDERKKGNDQNIGKDSSGIVVDGILISYSKLLNLICCYNSNIIEIFAAFLLLLKPVRTYPKSTTQTAKKSGAPYHNHNPWSHASTDTQPPP